MITPEDLGIEAENIELPKELLTELENEGYEGVHFIGMWQGNRVYEGIPGYELMDSGDFMENPFFIVVDETEGRIYRNKEDAYAMMAHFW